jgi:hypothetical protein
MKKFKVVIVSLFILLALFFSFSKMTFLFELIQFSFIPNTHQEKKLKILAKTFFKNGRLSPIIKERYFNDKTFLAIFAVEMIKNGKTVELKMESNLLLPIILEKFPENIFLDNLNLYRKTNPSKDWENFDSLSFRILENPKFNGISFDILSQSISNKKITEDVLFYMIYYLSWMNNFALAEDLLNWGIKEKKLDKNNYDYLKEDLHLRKTKNRFQVAHFSIDKPKIENTVRSFLNNKEIRIDFAQNLISDGSFTNQNSFKKYWDFSDMSDSEPWTKGSFYGDIDSVCENSMRVMGFFIKHIANKEDSRAGFLYKEEIPLAEKDYLFYFRYKTFRGEEMPSFWLSYAFNRERGLEPTDFKWREVYYIFNNRQFKIPTIRPLLRMWGIGSVWFDDIYLLEIEPGVTSIEKEIFFVN